jgi:hypothetical protein
MKLYLAARREAREEVAVVARLLAEHGHRITSRWVDGTGCGGADDALYDLTDIVVADALVLFTDERRGVEGATAGGEAHVAFGYALRAGKLLFVVGPPANAFHDLPSVTVVEDVAALLNELRRSGCTGAWS